LWRAALVGRCWWGRLESRREGRKSFWTALTATHELKGSANYPARPIICWAITQRHGAPASVNIHVSGFSRVYPGIDVVYYANGSQLEHDWLVAPGADPSRIRLSFPGQHPFIDAAGDVVISQSLRLKKPDVYQLVGGEKRRVSASYAERRGRVSFALAAYDHKLPLVIDPVLSYSTYIGGSGDDEILGTAADSSGNLYLTGATSSADFPTTKNTLKSQHPTSDLDAFVVKLSPDGKTILYATYLGGGDDDQANAIASDAGGVAYVTGFTFSVDFPTSSGAYQTENQATNQAAFVTALSADGSSLVYSTYFSGTVDESGLGIVVDASGTAYITGTSDSPDLTALNSNAGGGDTFVAQINSTGTGVGFIRYLGGSADDEGFAIALDPQGGVAVGGFTNSPDFPLKNAIQATHNGIPAFPLNRWRRHLEAVPRTDCPRACGRWRSTPLTRPLFMPPPMPGCSAARMPALPGAP